MIWFDLLESRGFFSPESNPAPVRVKDGFHIPYWDSLSYLVKVSSQIKEGKHSEYSDRLVEIIANVSKKPVDNYRTWHSFIAILTNLPNEKVSIDVLSFIPVWLESSFDTMLQTSELGEKLLGKFLNGNPTTVDIQKAEFILKHLFAIKYIEGADRDVPGRRISYGSQLHLYFLRDAIVTKGLVTRISQFCSNDCIFQLASNLKKVLLEYHKGIRENFSAQGQEYELKARIIGTSLAISYGTHDDEQIPLVTISNYEQLGDDELKTQIVNALNGQSIFDVDNVVKNIVFHLSRDMDSVYLFDSIHQLDDHYHQGENIKDTFSLILRELLREKARQHPSEASELFRSMFNGKEFRLPFFKRLALDAIGENWGGRLSQLFWELLDSNDPLGLFSEHAYEREVYRLLTKNAAKFTSDEIDIISNIVDNGQSNSQDKTEQYREYWKHKWYSAIKDNPFFKQIDIRVDLDSIREEFENIGEVKFTSGSESPLSVEDLSNMDPSSVSQYIKDFKPSDVWNGPSINGLAKNVGEAISIKPESFANEIDLFTEVRYIYAYHIVNGFQTAWKNKINFDWKKVLLFCDTYSNDGSFKTDKLKHEGDEWRSDHGLVLGAIANLINEGTQNDNNAFMPDLLDQAKALLVKHIPSIPVSNDFESTKMGYPTYTLNSVSGKLLRALIDLSLRKARIKGDDAGARWENDLKLVYEIELNRRIIDAYILLGMYYQQFLYLDSKWTKAQLKNFADVDLKYWAPLMGGIVFANPPYNKDTYELMFPLYNRAVHETNHLDTFPDHGIARHIGVFYLRGYESLSEDALITKYIKKDIQNVSNLVVLFRQQEKHIKSLEDRSKYENLILDFWRLVLDLYENSTYDSDLKTLSQLNGLIDFVPQLDHETTGLIQRTVKFSATDYDNYEIVDALIALKEIGDPRGNAKSINLILDTLIQKGSYIAYKEKQIVELIEFLYGQGEIDGGNKICNKLAMKGYEFQKESFLKHNNTR